MNDNETMSERIRETVCDQVADHIILTFFDFHMALYHINRRDAEAEIAEIQDFQNRRLEEIGQNDFRLDLHSVRIQDRVGDRTLWEWAKNLSKIRNDKREAAMVKYRAAFRERYFDLIFTDAFSNLHSTRT